MISGYLIGDKDLIARLTSLPEKIKPALDATVQRMGLLVKSTSQNYWLRGPRPQRLGVKTGRLLSSVATRFESTPTSSIVYVGTNVTYGIAWERGFDRKVGAGSRGGHFWGMSQGALTSYFGKHPPGVKHMAARPFLAPALLQNRTQIIDEIAKTLNEAAVQAMKA